MDITRRVLQSIAVVSITLTVLIIGARVVAPTASALTVDEIRVQIQELMAKIDELKQQLARLQGVTPEPDTKPHRICAILYRNLSQGTQGDDVRGLQEFLSAEGHFAANATGYFGPATAQAVAKWQTREGVTAAGSFGPLSRERIKRWCGDPQNNFLVARPVSGNAPLTVNFSANVNLSNSGVIADAGDYKIVFGDGNEQKLICAGTEPTCRGPHAVSHTYASNGSYTATLVHYGYFPSPDRPNSNVVGRIAIRVGDIACTKEYRPICGAKPIVCITTPCNPVPQTYGNRCMMNADGASFLYEGQCRADTDPANDRKCKAWFDGCNSCSRTSPDGPAMCTLKACLAGAMARPYCTAWFDDSGNKPPVISGFSGPTTLNVNQTGTWTINASDPENGQLTYTIRWGDENYAMAPGLSMVPPLEDKSQKTTFTHSYGSAGTYTVTIVVRDAAGKEAKTSTTVRVGATSCPALPPFAACPAGYTAVWIYDDKGCKVSSQCVVNAVCPGPQPTDRICTGTWEVKTRADTYYGSGCSSEWVCTQTLCAADAMQCSDGSWVGRTGPNCQFVCPSTSDSSQDLGNCPSGYGWCPAGASGYSCGLLTNGQCPAVF